MCVLWAGYGKASCAGMVTDSAHSMENNFPVQGSAVLPKRQSLHCYAKEK